MNFGKKIKQILKNQKSGAILVEFAFAIPILVAILYFVLDGPGLRLYQLKLKNSAYLAVNMIQNLTDKRENKLINGDDLKKITLAVFGNIYRSDTMLLKSGENDTYYYPLEHYGHIYLWCIYGNEDGTASVKWVWASGAPGKSPTEFNSTVFKDSSSDLNNTIVKFGKSAAPVYIYKDLAVNPGETKMILEVSLIVHPRLIDSSSSNEEENNNGNEDEDENNENEDNEEQQTVISNGNVAEVIAASKKIRASGAGKLGFYLLPLKPMAGTQSSYLNYVVIFKPKSGLFNIEEGPV